MGESTKTTAYDFESFLQCSLCSQEITEPKLLPCFHRFCLHCIAKYTEDTPIGTSYSCPECDTEFDKGKDGVTGLQTDLYAEILLDCLQLQRSFKNTQQKRSECFCCSMESVSSAYCFKCSGYLCKNCLHLHENNKIAENHRAFLKVLPEETEAISIEEIIRLKGLPRCEIHPLETERLSCESCNGKIVCVECWYHEHSGHSAVSVDEAAGGVRVGEHLTLLTQHITEISNFIKKEEKSCEKESESMKERNRRIKILHEAIGNIDKEVQVADSKIDEKKKILFSEEKEHIRELRREMDTKIDEIKKKYEKQIQERRKETQVRVQELEKPRKGLTERKSAMLSKVSFIQNSVKESIVSVQSTNKMIKKMNASIRRFQTLKERLHDLERSSDSCIIAKLSVAITSAVDSLIQEFGNECPGVIPITNVEVKTPEVKEEVTITAQEEVSVRITQPGDHVFGLEAIAGLENGNMIVLGRKRNYFQKETDEYQVIIADIKGKIVKQKVFKELGIPRYSVKFLACLDKNRVLILSNFNELFVTDTRDFSYEVRSIQDITSSAIKRISCMTSDVKNKRLIMCYNMTIYVIDNELRLQDSFGLSHSIGTCDAIEVLNDLIFTCDFSRRKAFVSRNNGDMCQRLDNPHITSCQWMPKKICTDGNKYVYFLWEGGKNGNIIVQYEHGQTEIVAIRLVDKSCKYISLLRVDGQDKLILGKENCGMSLLIYGLQQIIRIVRQQDKVFSGLTRIEMGGYTVKIQSNPKY